MTALALALGSSGLIVAVAALTGVIRLTWQLDPRPETARPARPRGLDRPDTAEAARREVLLAARIVRSVYGPDAEPGPSSDLGEAVVGLIDALDRLDHAVEVPPPPRLDPVPEAVLRTVRERWTGRRDERGNPYSTCARCGHGAVLPPGCPWRHVGPDRPHAAEPSEVT